ncbi:Uncharacterized protein dnm_094010 [Desulfonema magnum]|uniref:Uncharacterized protein n=1 Tax=Desulfonema magnum TaxID=45655 RepID=A0A975GTP0_9BACT|nr:Uncharacterized protein dnm_094010 [Desulfonema magnum]
MFEYKDVQFRSPTQPALADECPTQPVTTDQMRPDWQENSSKPQEILASIFLF